MPIFLPSNLLAFRLTLAYLLHDPPSLLPHATVPTLLSLPFPLGSTLPRRPRISALVLDKDNTLCPPQTIRLEDRYVQIVKRVQKEDVGVLIVSNSAGTDDHHEDEARELERRLPGVHVLRLRGSGKKKPFCGPEVMETLRRQGWAERPEQVLVVGDRLGTDVLLAREMGAWSLWCRDGWREVGDVDVDGSVRRGSRDYRGVLARLEGWLERVARRRGRVARLPGEER